MDKETIPVILLTYKDTELIKPILETIQEDFVDVRIVILDNGSTETTWKKLNEIEDSRVTLIRSSENLGYTGGINYAVNFACKSVPGFKNFFIINPDAKCTRNVIHDLAAILNANDQFACVSPKIVSIDGHITYSGGKINPMKGTVKHIVFTEDHYSQEFFEVDAYTGCAVLFDLNKFRQCGMLNEDLFIYYDEADSSIKLKDQNLKILYAPSLKVFHDTSYTMRKVSYLKTYYMTRNKFIVFNSEMKMFNKIYFLAHEFAYHLKNKRVKNAFYHIKGYVDFLKGKKGCYAK